MEGAVNRKNTEVRICKDEKWHIADIYTNSEVVIELQYSSIDKQTIRAREAFYGERMLWLLNKRQMNIVPMELDSFYIDRPLPFSIYFDIKELGFPAWIADFLSYTPTEKLKRSLLENGFVFDTLLKKYFKISSMRTCRKFGFSADISGSLVDEIRIFSRGISKQNPKLKKFSLIKSQKTWSDSGRNIFIDKSSNDILWIKSFKCNKYGIVEVLKKQDFIDKYTATKQ